MNSSINSRECKSSSRRRGALLLACCVFATGCNNTRAPAQDTSAPPPSTEEIERRLRKISEVALTAQHASEAPAIAWETLAATLPNSIGKLTATAAATGHTELGGTQISKATRRYAVGEQNVEVDLLDASRAQGMLLAFMLQHSAAQHPTKQAAGELTTSATNVGIHPAITRVTATTQQSTVTLVVAQRFIFEVRVNPATTPDEALRIAGALPLSTVANLARKPANADLPPASATSGTSAPSPTAPTAPLDDDPDQP